MSGEAKMWGVAYRTKLTESLQGSDWIREEKDVRTFDSRQEAVQWIEKNDRENSHAHRFEYQVHPYAGEDRGRQAHWPWCSGTGDESVGDGRGLMDGKPAFAEDRARANRLGDECGRLKTLCTELEAENSRLRREVERLQRRVSR